MCLPADMFDEARATRRRQPQLASRPLAGLAVTVKDLFDIQGQTTAAGSTVLADMRGRARATARRWRACKAAGGIVGRTNMVEFAFSGVGINPHFGTPANAASRDQALIPGGSSSGAAVSVATGAAFIGLGSDTGGSIRIPAALNGIVGFKNTARLVPTAGALPLSSTLDTVCALTRSVADAIAGPRDPVGTPGDAQQCSTAPLPPGCGPRRCCRTTWTLR
jgi:aspartyl-tRNA(Asn)/glutamyl-tRNA(Gln) amidotransferase subunit A